jgi:hypothetical protein
MVRCVPSVSIQRKYAAELSFQCVQVQDLKVQEQAAGTIRNLSAVPENRAALVQVMCRLLLLSNEGFLPPGGHDQS